MISWKRSCGSKNLDKRPKAPASSAGARHRLAIVVCAVAFFTAGRAASAADPDELAARIDQHLATAWHQAGVQPAPLTDDATFLRRLSLDLIGRIPTVAETRAFLADTRLDKRRYAIQRLQASSAHADHMAAFWRRTWVPQADTRQFANLRREFEGWLGTRLQANAPYDQMAVELLSFRIGSRDVETKHAGQTVSPRAFLVASESKPENLAANTMRAFLGVNLECAQCHDHPFARWSRDQFWQTAAFFARPVSSDGTTPEQLELTIPGTDRIVHPHLLTDSELQWPETIEADTGRRLLAAWVTAADNPYFARNAVNRLWAYFLGTGLVEPLEDLSGQNPASHPELLNELASEFATSGYDLQYLTTAIVLSRGYQLASTSEQDLSSAGDPRLFARMPVRGLTGEQLYDSLRVAAGLPVERADLSAALPAGEARQSIAAQFRVERTVSAERSIMQALTMMNGPLIDEVTDPLQSPTLSAVLDAPFLDRRAKIETLVLAVLNRRATEEELFPLLGYVTEGGSEKDERQAVGDVFWALLNSSEFNTNH